MIKNICCIGAGYVGGPTMAVIPLANSKVDFVANVLYPCNSNDFRRRGMCNYQPVNRFLFMKKFPTLRA